MRQEACHKSNLKERYSTLLCIFPKHIQRTYTYICGSMYIYIFGHDSHLFAFLIYALSFNEARSHSHSTFNIVARNVAIGRIIYFAKSRLTEFIIFCVFKKPGRNLAKLCAGKAGRKFPNPFLPNSINFRKILSFYHPPSGYSLFLFLFIFFVISWREKFYVRGEGQRQRNNYTTNRKTY